MVDVLALVSSLLLALADLDPKAVDTFSVADFVNLGEGKQVEFKSTLRVNLHTGEKDKRMEQAVVKTVAGFLNTNGGTLIIGVGDDGHPIGLQTDQFVNLDKMHLHLDNLLKSRIGPEFSLYIHTRFDEFEDEQVMIIEVSPSRSSAFVKDGNSERFHIRTGASTSELTPSETQRFIQERFK